MVERDHWSTDHAEARRTKIDNLIDLEGAFVCEDCGKGPTELPISGRFHRDHPNANLLRLAEGDLAIPNLRLECDHVDKNIENNDLTNLRLLCNSCHALADRQTGVGVAQLGADPDPMGYAISDLCEPGYVDPNFTEAVVAHARKSGKKAKVEEFLESIESELLDDEDDILQD